MVCNISEKSLPLTSKIPIKWRQRYQVGTCACFFSPGQRYDKTSVMTSWELTRHHEIYRQKEHIFTWIIMPISIMRIFSVKKMQCQKAESSRCYSRKNPWVCIKCGWNRGCSPIHFGHCWILFAKQSLFNQALIGIWLYFWKNWFKTEVHIIVKIKVVLKVKQKWRFLDCC